ncbi:hypothetical protein SAMD00019534_073740 [Acytostelium subglobosum LB1]|uniref:hypothetical protein n=1 Tax=Acytostelium subglobosum LB1 TaxID=1410327 RepID=UPI000644EECB|nr:hypothetical protein SAMD00019534_073740 [Acytostelium subglobosum LB1]GAM24199.1 hypothetical protein SAMD00019534_073740 [Acytostelium subglobosum LB1]|eukprot:XP_012752525.1 hypothetical protein SAMD00019534_073740 [Acytostelium subglobosum LB1]
MLSLTLSLVCWRWFQHVRRHCRSFRLDTSSTESIADLKRLASSPPRPSLFQLITAIDTLHIDTRRYATSIERWIQLFPSLTHCTSLATIKSSYQGGTNAPLLPCLPSSITRFKQDECRLNSSVGTIFFIEDFLSYDHLTQLREVDLNLHFGTGTGSIPPLPVPSK